VVIIGGGWIGLETAAAARAAGLDVTVLEQAELPLLRVLGYDVAQVFAGLHRDNKVDLRCGVQVAAIIGTEGHVTGVRLGDGTLLVADIVLVGVGITPNAYECQRLGRYSPHRSAHQVAPAGRRRSSRRPRRATRVAVVRRCRGWSRLHDGEQYR
jgi:NADPH-dependent 2,4-dienoyl-CoA reductase/sulfur reductase-like enzyme